MIVSQRERKYLVKRPAHTDIQRSPELLRLIVRPVWRQACGSKGRNNGENQPGMEGTSEVGVGSEELEAVIRKNIKVWHGWNWGIRISDWNVVGNATTKGTSAFSIGSIFVWWVKFVTEWLNCWTSMTIRILRPRQYVNLAAHHTEEPNWFSWYWLLQSVGSARQPYHQENLLVKHVVIWPRAQIRLPLSVEPRTPSNR